MEMFTLTNRACRQKWLRATLIAIAIVVLTLPLGMPPVNLILWLPMAPIMALIAMAGKATMTGRW